MTAEPCCDWGWVILEWRPAPLVEPCPDHLVEQNRRWDAGKYRPQPWDWFVDLEEVR